MSQQQQQQPPRPTAAPPPAQQPKFYLGGLASMMAACCTHPLELIKVRLQTFQQKGNTQFLPTLKLVVRDSGVLGLYNGLSASLLRQATYSMMRFGSYDVIKKQLEDPSRAPLTVGYKITAGILAGAIGGLCGNPADVVNVRMQADGRLPVEQRRNYRHAFDGLRRMVTEEGAAALFKGVVPNLQRAVLMTAAQLATYDQTKQFLMEQYGCKDTVLTHLYASMASGFVATVVTQPVDVIKTRIMNSKTGEFAGPIDCLRRTLAGEGASALYKGFWPAYARLGPHTILTFIFLEKLKRVL
ncbi:solute carrier family 25 [Capsaspora owczarzaki ATCC 30864]|uniref:Solute carrier family 25 n=1 Tax=Capsaspora owczarzaki (strain ATCC 30864) TaxID=595528 RepID=A0A0D2X3T2_CAPO3|nr:solute carrier family 25 [Capsaspora owczarzaki ATCC 30864]